jgi:hypothetical protein
MPDITYVYLPEGEDFDAASLNTRFQTVVDGVNGVMEFGTPRGAFGEQHLNPTGVLAEEAFPTLTVNKHDESATTIIYTTWGGNGVYPAVGDSDRELIDDGVNPLIINLTAPVRLGMANPDKIAGLLVLLNVHFSLGTITIQGDTTGNPQIGMMICVQCAYSDNPTEWFTIRKTERFQWFRSMNSEGQTTATPLAENGEPNILCLQDVGLRTLITQGDLPGPGVQIVGIRAAYAVYDPNGNAPPPAVAVVYAQEGNFTVIPLHAEVS